MIPAHKPRAMLAVLLLDAGRVVPSERLIEELWAGAPPASARPNLRTYAGRLRLAVSEDPGAVGRLRSESTGYRLVLGDDVVDLIEFERWCGRAAAAEARGDHLEAMRSYDRVREFWRGQPFGNVPVGPVLREAAERLHERYWGIVENWFELRLRMTAGAGEAGAGSLGNVVADLRRHVAEHPLRERPRRQLMLALYRSGDPVGALQVYDDLGRGLRARSGVEPGEKLRRLRHAILQRDPRLEPGIGQGAL